MSKASLPAALFAAYATVTVVAVTIVLPPFRVTGELNHAERAEQVDAGPAGIWAVPACVRAFYDAGSP